MMQTDTKKKRKVEKKYIDKWIENKSNFQKFKNEFLKRVVVIVNMLES
jgi:hypothetical protein